jgi:hypothetical protein
LLLLLLLLLLRVAGLEGGESVMADGAIVDDEYVREGE